MNSNGMIGESYFDGSNISCNRYDILCLGPVW